MRLFLRVIASFIFLLCAGIAFATIFGAVQGVVHDPQHRPIAGAAVILKSATSDWSRTTQSDQDGEFRIEAVPLGAYIVTVSHAGFESLQQNVTVLADASPVLHFPLQIAALTQKVTVSQQAETVNADTAAPTTLVSREEIANTPGADRTNSLQMITDYVPGAYVTHDQLHIRGGHQVSWLIDGVPIPNTNIAGNLGPQIDPKDIDYLEVQRGSYGAENGDRTYGVFDVLPRTGWSRNNEGELTTSFGNFYQTNDELNFGSHTDRLAYFVGLNGNRSNVGLQTPVAGVFHDAENGYGGFGSLMFNADPKDQLRFVSSLRRDYYQIPYDPNPNDVENQQFNSSGLRDGQQESDTLVEFSWVRTINPNTLLTVSPFYHFNRANYHGSPNDTPSASTDDRASSYAGGQATLALDVPKNEMQFGAYGFAQHDDETFGLICNPPTASCTNFTEHGSPDGSLSEAWAEDNFHVAPWLTLIGGVRQSHFSGQLAENATSPRVGASLRVPHVDWIFHAFYGHYYQAPPLLTASGTLIQFCNANSCGFLPLSGERDEEHQFGVTIPFRGWFLDADNFQTRAVNFFDHNNVGDSDIFFPLTVQQALIRGWELTLRSPRLWRFANVHLAYSNQVALGRPPITGGLTNFAPPAGYFPLDHDQRNTLNVGFSASLPRRVYAAGNVYYGSGFTNGQYCPACTPPVPNPYLPGHTTVDLSLGKSFGESFSLSINALNIANRRLLIDDSVTFGGFHYDDPREIYAEFRYRFHF
ncbi:MAG TPA: TonB-dependent receptor [Candidatus Acidoferrales bacterium]|nr:TonB-dependent receptor [Candidatus Acidoferrales bacterium]